MQVYCSTMIGEYKKLPMRCAVVIIEAVHSSANVIVLLVERLPKHK